MKKSFIFVCLIFLIGFICIGLNLAGETDKKVFSEIESFSPTQAELEIAYDDGSQEQTWTGGIAGYVMSVCFTPPFYPCTLKEAKFYMNTVGYNFKVHV